MLQPGDTVPDFSTTDQNGKKFSRENLRGKKHVLFFYPHDNTPTCTVEACNLRDNYRKLRKLGYEVVGVSVDDEKSHKRFINKFELPYRLLTDVNHELVTAFGIWGRKKFMGREFDGTFRTTFIVDENLVISHTIDKVKSKMHSEQIIAELTKKIN